MPEDTLTVEETVETPAAEAVEETVERTPYVFPFTLGADPEFTVLTGMKPLRAQEFLQAFIKDKTVTNSGFEFEGGNIGWDNHQATGEVRPKPGDPRQVAANIRSLFKEVIDRVPFADFTTLTVSAATGGHIHLAIPEEMNNLVATNSPMFRAMQRGIASFVMLIMLGENNLSRSSRRNAGNGYGDVMDFRVDPKFSWPSGAPGYTLEVRGPTAEWITSEKLAVGTLAYMAIAWDSMLEAMRVPKGTARIMELSDILFKTKQQADDSVVPFLANYANVQRLYLARMRPFIRKHPAYLDYKDELDLILDPSRTLMEKRNHHFNVSEGWGFGVTSKDIKVKEFMKDSAIDAKTSAFPDGVMRNVSQFNWNDDLNVETFATALSKRCVALGWKPQHEYFLFGMKKGLDAIVVRNEQGKFIMGSDIIKTRSDYTQLNKKFDRLLPKAVPAFGNVLNPRTGEVAKQQDMSRVMVGIPYTMRQKGDVKDVIRMILDFEKTPGKFPEIVMKDLPNTPGTVEKVLADAEDTDQKYAKSMDRAEPMMSLRGNFRQEEDDADASESLINGTDTETANHATEESYDIAAQALERMLDGRDVSGLVAEEELEHWTGSALAIDAALEDPLLAGFTDVFRSEDDLEDIFNRNPAFFAWLICYGIGQRGRASVLPLAQRAIHRVWRDGDTYGFDSPNHGVRGAGVPSADTIMDMLGISDPTSRQSFRDNMDSREGNMITVQPPNPGQEMMAGSVSRVRSDMWIVNPNPALPSVWVG